MVATRALTREKIFEIARSLPPAPKVLAGLGPLLTDVNVDLDRVAELIKRDSVLSGHIIRVSNSIVYHGTGETGRIGQIEEAIGRVGFHEVYRLVGMATTSRLADRPLLHYGVKADPFREHIILTAFVSEALAEASGMDPRQAYTAGLMRTLGILVLDRVAELLAPIEPYDHESCGSYLVWEGRAFSIGNCEVAALILGEWLFPAEIIAAVREHYLTRDADYENRLACLLNVASGIVAVSGHALPGEYRHWDSTPRKLEVIGLTAKQVNRASDRAREAFDSFRKQLLAGDVGRAGKSGSGKSLWPWGQTESPEPTSGGLAASTAAPAVPSSEEPAPTLVTEASAPAPTVAPPAEPPRKPIVASPAPVDTDEVKDFPSFVRRYQDMVFSTAARLVNNDAQAEDISQEVFLKAYERWSDLSASATAGGWLKTVATNLSLNYLQRYRKRWTFFSEFKRADDDGGEDSAPVEFADSANFFSGIDRADRQEWVEKALAQLPDHQRVPLLLYHFDDMPYDEIAARLRVSLAKVKTDILRGRAALARLLMRGGGAEQRAS
jgi:RNA polymerase sigma-70 factor (ECF subfamily)